MRGIFFLCIAALAVLIPGSTAAAPSPAPVLSLVCGQRDRAGHVACALSGHGFSRHETLQITYRVDGLGPRSSANLYPRTARTDARGRFTRPRMVLPLPSHYALDVQVQSRLQRLPAELRFTGKSAQVLSWRCGDRRGNGEVPCQVTGHGFRAGQMLSISYGWTLGGMTHRPSYGSVVRRQRVDARGTFIPPVIWMRVPTCYDFDTLILSGTTRQGSLLASVVASEGRPSLGGRC